MRWVVWCGVVFEYLTCFLVCVFFIELFLLLLLLCLSTQRVRQANMANMARLRVHPVRCLDPLIVSFQTLYNLVDAIFDFALLAMRNPFKWEIFICLGGIQ